MIRASRANDAVVGEEARNLGTHEDRNPSAARNTPSLSTRAE
jgi:hypothetical protein